MFTPHRPAVDAESLGVDHLFCTRETAAVIHSGIKETEATIHVDSMA